ncbi:hypothetical protein MPSEU_000469500 [Mayamaea pseudoterrestris]|nr:hypothetical protein MPSEU_000469500 [Mayamaea pseudoterrestris]
MTLIRVLVLIGGLSSSAFHVQPSRTNVNIHRLAAQSSDDSTIGISRSDAIMKGVLDSIITGSLLLASPSMSRADVADGNVLPQGAAQFSRVLRLKSDLQGVKRRVVTGGELIGKPEWDNISRFLRTAYSTGDDMKAVAGGVADPERKRRALTDVDLVRQYAQAGEIPVSKKSPEGLVPVLEKMSALVDDFLDALSDIPDEI